MKMYNKFSRLLMVFALLLFTCETEETLTITEPGATFELQTPGITSINLNFGLISNPAFTLSWNDGVTGSNSYDIEMSLTEGFETPTVLGNSSTDSFTINVEDLNMAINSAGPDVFNDIAVYVRVNAGSAVSNSVLFFVDAYPLDPATITSPSQNDAFVLDIASQDLVVLSFTWEDGALTTSDNVDYVIEAALGGTNFDSFIPLGSVSNTNTLDITHSELNQVAIGLGIASDTATDMDLRIVSLTTNASGNTYQRTSDAITINVTPYNVSFPYIYFVGDATTPGWNNNNNNTPIFRSQDTPNSYFYTGFFNAGAFKLLETPGQWQPQWGDNGGSLGVNDGSGSDPGVFSVPAAGYYTLTINSLTEGASYTFEAFDASSAPTYTTMGLIGSATPNGWDGNNDTNFTQDANNPHLWYINDVNLVDGEFLIRANDVWPGNAGAAVWRYTGSDELFGSSNLDNGGGDNFPFSGPGTYDIWFNDLDGSYVIIPQ